MTFDTLTAPQGRAIWELAAAMTRWDPLDPGAAPARLHKAVERAGLLPGIGQPPDFHELPPPPESFVQALSRLRSASLDTKKGALRGALEVALGPGTLPLAQNLALRTVVDALDLAPSELERLFLERTGTHLPPPWDPSLKSAWLHRENQDNPWDDARATSLPEQDARILRIKALALLGLDEGASLAEIKRAFLRISQVHHPDHYASLGPEATREADRSFRRIKDAYEHLLKAEP